jgi:hypothetical protein|tara:strand:- start:23 stop:337 length:315 start_codon:yes stop_codon:yes gene_type:complete
MPVTNKDRELAEWIVESVHDSEHVADLIAAHRESQWQDIDHTKHHDYLSGLYAVQLEGGQWDYFLGGIDDEDASMRDSDGYDSANFEFRDYTHFKRIAPPKESK